MKQCMTIFYSLKERDLCTTSAPHQCSPSYRADWRTMHWNRKKKIEEINKLHYVQWFSQETNRLILQIIKVGVILCMPYIFYATGHPLCLFVKNIQIFSYTIKTSCDAAILMMYICINWYSSLTMYLFIFMFTCSATACTLHTVSQLAMLH